MSPTAVAISVALMTLLGLRLTHGMGRVSPCDPVANPLLLHRPRLATQPLGVAA